jgi:hypothetical protein
VTGAEGEALVEKQNAERRLMPVVSDETALYGYVNEDRHMVQTSLNGRMPEESWREASRSPRCRWPAIRPPRKAARSRCPAT